MPVAGRYLKVEVRTVNHRFFNPSIRLPGELAALESDVREALKRSIDRGHVTLSARWVEDVTGRAGEAAFPIERARAVVAELRGAVAELGLSGEITVDQLLRFPGLFSDRSEAEVGTVAWDEVAPVMAAAVEGCRAARMREGAALAADIRHRLELIAAGAARLAELVPARLERETARLGEAVRRLAGGLDLDAARMTTEIALLADRMDITEETVRLRSHLEAAVGMLNGSGPVGKQLGFIAQEIGREVNTIGSKANDAAIASEVIAMKGELEKIREQLENLE